MLYLL